MGKSGAAAPDDLSLDAAAFAALCDTVIRVSGRITELFSDLIGLIVMTSIGEDVETSTVEIPDGPKISAFSLPYFFDENDTLLPRRMPSQALRRSTSSLLTRSVCQMGWHHVDALTPAEGRATSAHRVARPPTG